MSFRQHISQFSSFFHSLRSEAGAIESTRGSTDRRAKTAGGCGRLWWGPAGGACGHTSSEFPFPAGQKGAQLYEFAVTLPIALLVFTGLLSFGVYLNKSIELTNSTSLAGQYLSISRSVTTDPCATFASALQNVSPYLQPSSLSYSFTFSSTTPVFSGSYTGTTCTAGAAGMLQGGSATIQVSYPCTIGIFGLNLAPGCTLISQVTEIIQ